MINRILPSWSFHMEFMKLAESHLCKIYFKSLYTGVYWTLLLLHVGQVHLSFYGCQVYFVTFILFLMENPVSKQCRPRLEKSSVLPVLDQFLKLKTDLFLDKKLKNQSIKLCIAQDFAIHRLTLIVTCQNCSHLLIRCFWRNIA